MNWNILVALVFALTLVTAAASALPVVIEQVEVDGTEVFSTGFNSLDIERGQDVDVTIEFTVLEDVENVELFVFLSGYEYNDKESISQVLGPYDLQEDRRYVREATLTLPFDLDVDEYKLRLVMANRNGEEIVERYDLQIDTPRHALNIADVLFVPGQTVRAGEGLITKVRVENRGQRDEKDVRVKVSIPDLGLTQQGFINEIEDMDEQEETEDLLLRIPTCTEAGTYDAEVTVEFNRGREQLKETYGITVLESDLCNRDSTPKTTITLGTDLQTIKQGESGIYSVAVQNTGSTSTAYNLVVSAPEGVSYKISPTSATVLAAGQAQTFYLFVEVGKDATEGPNVLTVSLNAGNQELQQLSLTANVEGSSVSVKRVLEVGLVVLIVLLVVIGLIVGLSRLRGDGDDKATYY